MTPPGFPHSDISGSTAVCASPKLFAACHVLHRFPEPRHPPCALCCLTSISSAPQRLLLAAESPRGSARGLFPRSPSTFRQSQEPAALPFPHVACQRPAGTAPSSSCSPSPAASNSKPAAQRRGTEAVLPALPNLRATALLPLPCCHDPAAALPAPCRPSTALRWRIPGSNR